jgi:hypothetical protein
LRDRLVRPRTHKFRYARYWTNSRKKADALVGCVHGFDQDEAESKRDKRGVVPRCLLTA